MKGDTWRYGGKRRTGKTKGKKRVQVNCQDSWLGDWVGGNDINRAREYKIASRFCRESSRSLQTCLMHLRALCKTLRGSGQYKTTEWEVVTRSAGKDRPTKRRSTCKLRIKTGTTGDFQGGPVVRILPLQCRTRFNPWSGNWDPCMLHSEEKSKQTNKHGHRIGIKYDILSYKLQRT